MNFEGTTVAMVTPFTKDDGVDETGMRENINYLIENGVNGILAAGTTGESATITHESCIQCKCNAYGTRRAPGHTRGQP